MARRDGAPGFGARIERVRVRLGGPSKAEFSRVFGISGAGYHAWVERDAEPGAATLARGLKGLGVVGADRLAWWLATGEGSPPPWLDDETLDPRAPEAAPPGGSPPRPGLAMPSAAIEAARSAHEELEAMRSAGGLREPGIIRAWHALDSAKDLFSDHDSGSRWSSDVVPQVAA